MICFSKTGFKSSIERVKNIYYRLKNYRYNAPVVTPEGDFPIVIKGEGVHTMISKKIIGGWAPPKRNWHEIESPNLTFSF